ncbi:MAG: TolC family protein [Acidobacteriaceae bacterium]
MQPANLAVSSSAAAVVIDLPEAVRRAQMSDPTYAGAAAASRVAAQGRTIARSAFLPNVHYYNQYLYTQSQHLPAAELERLRANGQTPTPAFIANNGVHEYVSQAQVNETVGLGIFAQYKRAGAVATLASAQQEVARRALVVNVVNAYFTLLAADGKEAVAQRAEKEAAHFSELTQKLEAGGEVAHADVVKADLQLQQRQRDLSDAKLAAEKSRLDLGVLLFPDPRTDYKLADDFSQIPPVPVRAVVEAAARTNNPELRSALAAVEVANQDVSAARAAYLPDLALNYSYGIDAAQFAANGPDGARNLAYSASATLDIPIWDWFATQGRVRQAKAIRSVAKTQLTNTQRRLVAELEEYYSEAQVSGSQLASLDQSVKAARESLRLTNLRYTAGEATVLEVVDAQNMLMMGESARDDGVVRYRVALANLQTLTGVLP